MAFLNVTPRLFSVLRLLCFGWFVCVLNQNLIHSFRNETSYIQLVSWLVLVVSLSFFSFAFVYCACTHVVVHTYAHSQVGHRHLFHCLLHDPLSSTLQTGFLTEPELGYWPANSSNLPVPHHSPVLGLHVSMAIPSFFCRTIGFELKSSCFLKPILLRAEPHPQSCFRFSKNTKKH